MKPAKEKEHLLSASIKYHRSLSGYSREQISELLDFSVSTFQVKLADPNKFTLGEIIKLSKLFDTT